MTSALVAVDRPIYNRMYSEALQRDKRLGKGYTRGKIDVFLVRAPKVENHAIAIINDHKFDTHIILYRAVLDYGNPFKQLKGIYTAVAAKYGLTLEQIIHGGKKRFFVYARQEAMYEAVLKTDKSYPEIAFHMGGKDHTTILHGVSQHCLRNDLEHPRGGYVGPTKYQRAKAKRDALKAGGNNGSN